MISIPFSGNKRYSYKTVKEIVKSGGYERVYEPFGGSCVLSVNLVKDGVVEYAVANDYDHFFDMYPEYLDLKDEVVKECYAKGLKRTNSDSKRGIYVYNDDGTIHPIKSTVLNPKDKEILRKIVSDKVPEKYWKYFALGNNFMHSTLGARRPDKIKINDFSHFNAYLKTDKQRAYLDALNQIELEHLDYRDFIEKHKNEIKSHKSLLILDPPYIATYQEQYEEQFTIEDTLELIEIVKGLGCDFIFFNSSMEFIESVLSGVDCELSEINLGSTISGKRRKDSMAYVRRGS